MIIEELLGALGERVTPPERSRREFAELCRRVDNDPREQQRIDDAAELIDAEEVIYGQALAAVDRRDTDAAEPLLRRAAAAGIGEADYLLAELLEERDPDEAINIHRGILAQGDTRSAHRLELLQASQPSLAEPASAVRDDPGLLLVGETADVGLPDLLPDGPKGDLLGLGEPDLVPLDVPVDLPDLLPDDPAGRDGPDALGSGGSAAPTSRDWMRPEQPGRQSWLEDPGQYPGDWLLPQATEGFSRLEDPGQYPGDPSDAPSQPPYYDGPASFS